MRPISINSTGYLLLLGTLVFGSACAEDLDGAAGTRELGASCEAGVLGMLVHDAREGTVKDSAIINLNEAANLEMPIACDATVVLVVGDTRTTLQQTLQGQYEAGYSDITPGLPDLTLIPGEVHMLEVDIDSDGTVDITGEVRLSDITNFRATSATSSQVNFAWSDGGDERNTTYYVQASDRRDFTFADRFASGYVEGSTAIQFGGSSEWRYFTAGGTLYARVQADTAGTLTSPGRINAWAWPLEPILEY